MDKGFEKEEAWYVFESDDGTPFFFTPNVGEKCLINGVGPTRSGKSFLKNVIASHFTKLGGMYSALDIDQGTLPLANFLKKMEPHLRYPMICNRDLVHSLHLKVKMIPILLFTLLSK